MSTPTPQIFTQAQKRELASILMGVFVTPGELIQFMRWNDNYRPLVDSIDRSDICTASVTAVAALCEAGYLNDEFFKNLGDERPYLREEIARRRKWAGV